MLNPVEMMRSLVRPNPIDESNRVLHTGSLTQRNAARTQLEIEEINRLKRRRLITAIVGTTTIGAVAGTGAAIAFWQRDGHHEGSADASVHYFESLSTLPIERQLQEFDAHYSTTRLTKEAAAKTAIPLWARVYIQASGSHLTVEDITQNLHLDTADVNKPEEKGLVSIDYEKKMFTAFDFDWDAFKSNESSGYFHEQAQGIIFQRSGVTHEITHYDTAFHDDPELGHLMQQNHSTDPNIQYPDTVITNGFNVIESHPDGGGEVYFNVFDEGMTDVISSYIAKTMNRPAVMLYPNAPIYHNILDWLQFPPNDLMRLHQNSDVRGLAIALSKLSHAKTQTLAGDDTALTIEGIKIIRALNKGQYADLESYYPGIQQQAVNKPRRFIQ